mgnify:CR=1 FL=1
MKKLSLLFALCFLCVSLDACSSFSGEGAKESEDDPLKSLYLKPVAIQDVAIYDSANMDGFAAAVSKSCAAFAKKDPASSYGPTDLGGTAGDWINVCALAGDSADKNWLEGHFNAYQVQDDGDAKGLFTGYYEPLLHGSLKKTDRYNVPLYMLPNDLIEVDLGQFSDDLKGKKVSGRVKDNRLIPYDDRAAIDAGALDGRDLELVWVDDAVDAFFLQIQGSGLVEMTDGSIMRVGYAGQNGRSYYAIGRDLIKRGEVAKEDMSLQAIRKWLDENPNQAGDLMQLNPSYIFFRKLEGDGPLGAQGVALTPMASLAVDRRVYPYGMPVLLQADQPLEKGEIQQFMVAQDTGGAIRGVVRGDVFWGAGEGAALKAGHMKSDGKMWIFLPNTINVPEKFLRQPSAFDRITDLFKEWMK